MKLKLFRVKYQHYGQGYPDQYRFVLGVDQRVVALREGVRDEDVLELDNEVVVQFSVQAVYDVKKGN
jgi:hypothetical protein